MPAFADRLTTAIREKKNPVLVGLDPRIHLLPRELAPPEGADATTLATAACNFCREVIDIVAPLVPAVKPQAAFFEQFGPVGMVALGEVIKHAKSKGLLVIFDGKRNDIGSTAEAYAKGLLGESSPWGADALTVNPYLGEDSLEPFVEVAEKCDAGVFVLVKTSNPGSGMLQNLECDGLTIYQRVAGYVEQLAAEANTECGYGNVGAVVGATYPAELAKLREEMPNTLFLIPGFGSQGGSAKDVAAGFDSDGMGAIVNNSRGIIFAYHKETYHHEFGDDGWREAIQAATLEMIESLAAE